MNENTNWFDEQLKNAANATAKWPEWMKREAGISQGVSAPQQPQTQVTTSTSQPQVVPEHQNL